MAHTSIINTDIWVGLIIVFLAAMLLVIRRKDEFGFVVLELGIVAAMAIILFKFFIPTWGW